MVQIDEETKNITEVTSETQKVSFIGSASYKVDKKSVIKQNYDIKLLLNRHPMVPLKLPLMYIKKKSEEYFLVKVFDHN